MESGRGSITLKDILLSADDHWRKGDKDKCIKAYEDALEFAKGDEEKEAMVHMGLGFALLRMPELKKKGILHLLGAKSIADKRGEEAQAVFVQDIIAKASAQVKTLELKSGGAKEMQRVSGSDERKSGNETNETGIDKGGAEGPDAYSSCAKGLIIKYKVMLFMKGTPTQPECIHSLKTVKILDALGLDFYPYNVMKAHPKLQAAIKQIGKWPFFPQLYVNGKLFGGRDVIEGLDDDEELVEALKKAGIPSEGFGDPRERCTTDITAPGCVSGHAKELLGAAAAGDQALLSDEDSDLLVIISKEGTGDWKALAETLSKKFSRKVTSKEIRKRWREIKPIIKQKVESKAEMKCGHSCFTCPTRHECKLHDELDHDIEDLAVPTTTPK